MQRIQTDVPVERAKSWQECFFSILLSCSRERYSLAWRKISVGGKKSFIKNKGILWRSPSASHLQIYVEVVICHGQSQVFSPERYWKTSFQHWGPPTAIIKLKFKTWPDQKECAQRHQFRTTGAIVSGEHRMVLQGKLSIWNVKLQLKCKHLNGFTLHHSM